MQTCPSKPSALAAGALCAGLLAACGAPEPDTAQDAYGTGAAPTEAAAEPPAPDQQAGYATPTPEPDRDPATRAPTADLPDDYLLYPWTAKGVGADCEKPDFHITENPAGGLVIETRIDGSPRTGYVDRAGPGGGDAAFIFDATEFPIERRGVDGLAVMPPAGETPMLAGHEVAGDGVVFIQCPPA